MAEKAKRRKKKDRYYKDMLPALILPLVMAIHLYSVRAVLIALAGVLSAVICDFAACRILKQKTDFANMSTVYIGLLLSLMMPASAPLWLPALASAFAILFVKIPFGGASHAPFSPAAAAFAFISICFPDAVFAYPETAGFSSSCVYGTDGFIQGATVNSAFSAGDAPSVTAIELINAFIGSVAGPMGMTSAVIMAGLLVYILFKRRRSFINSVSFILTCAAGYVLIIALSGTRFLSENTLRLIPMHLFSGLTLCTAVFLVTEECVSPKKTYQRILYGASVGIAYLILSRVSAFEDSACFAVLFINALWPLADRYAFKKKEKEALREVTPREE